MPSISTARARIIGGFTVFHHTVSVEMKAPLTLPTLVFIGIAWLVLGSLSDLIFQRIRQRRISRFAASHGYTFFGKDTSKSAPFFENFSSLRLFARYEVTGAANIMRRNIGTLEFIYFEQILDLAEGFYIGHPRSRYTRSVVALDVSTDGSFAINLDRSQKLLAQREGDWIYIWMGNWMGKPKLVPVRKLKKLLDDAASIVEAGFGKTQFHTAD